MRVRRRLASVRTAAALLLAAVAAAAPSHAAPRRDLARDERMGGHTLSRHVGLSDSDLRRRLAREHVSAASTWTDRATAEEAVGEALTRSRGRIERWAGGSGTRSNLALDYRGDGRVVGRSLRRGDPAPRPCTEAVVVLRWREPPGTYYVLTAYPRLARGRSGRDAGAPEGE